MTPRIVLGPPGTGKTTELLRRVDDALTRGVPPDRIGYFSFTKRAAGEAVERACRNFGFKRADLRYFRTLHSLCFQAAGLSSGDVLEGRKVREFGHWIGVELSEFRFSDEGTTFGFRPGDRALFMENLARVRCVPLLQQYREHSDGLHWNFVQNMADGLAKYKRDQHLVDYTDMLSLFVDGGWTPGLDELYVDEGQDLSELQWRAVWKMAAACGNLTVAGDDDQAIYRWAGAAVDRFVGLEGEVSVLGQSHRCPVAVQAVSQRVVERIARRRTKPWSPRPVAGEVIRAVEVDDVDLGGDDVLVLVRNAFVARDYVIPHLQHVGIIYDWRGHSSVRPTVLEAVLAWERLRRGEQVTGGEARRVYAMMSVGRGVRRGYKQLPAVADEETVGLPDLLRGGGLQTEAIWHEALDLIPEQERAYMVRALERGERLTKRPRVRVSTIHGAKGGEAGHVVVMRDMASRTYAEMRDAPDDEARVWYVAVTRAKERLTLVEPQVRGNTAYDV